MSATNTAARFLALVKDTAFIAVAAVLVFVLMGEAKRNDALFARLAERTPMEGHGVAAPGVLVPAPGAASFEERIKGLEVEAAAMRGDLAQTRLRLGEIEAPYLPHVGRFEGQPAAGAGDAEASSPAPAFFTQEKADDLPGFRLVGVRRFQGEAQAYVLLPNSAESVVVTASSPVDGWHLAGVDLSRRAALFSQGRDVIEMLAKE